MIISLFENLPLVIFGLVFLISLIFLIIGLFLSSSAQDTMGLAKGRKMLIRATYSFSSLLLIVVVFLSVTWFLDKNVKDEPQFLDGYPSSPIDPNFPSAPEFVKISKTYFTGPYPFRDYALFSKPGIFALLCENEDDYDIIDIDSAQGGTDLYEHDNVECWSTVCEDIKIGIIWAPTTKGVIWEKSKILNFLEEENYLLCPIEE